MIRQAIAIALLAIFGILKMPAEKVPRRSAEAGWAAKDRSQPRPTRTGRAVGLSGRFEWFPLAIGCLSLDRSP